MWPEWVRWTALKALEFQAAKGGAVYRPFGSRSPVRDTDHGEADAQKRASGSGSLARIETETCKCRLPAQTRQRSWDRANR